METTATMSPVSHESKKTKTNIMNEAETRAELIDPKLKACGGVKSILDKAFKGDIQYGKK